MGQYLFFNGKEWVMRPYYYHSPAERKYWEKYGKLPDKLPDENKKPSRKEQGNDENKYR